MYSNINENNPYFVFLVMYKEKCTYTQAYEMIKAVRISHEKEEK